MRDRARSAPPRARVSRRVLGSLVVVTAAADLQEDPRGVGDGDGAWQRLLATSVHGLLPQKSGAPLSTDGGGERWGKWAAGGAGTGHSGRGARGQSRARA